MPDAVQLLEDREAIAEVVRTYARAVDQRRFDDIRGCFAPDLHVVDWSGVRDMDRDQTMAYISGVAIFRATMHMMGSQLVHVTGHEGTALTRALLTHTSDGTDARNEHAPVYVEKLEKRDGRWVIVERGGKPVLDGPAAASDDPAVRWLLDRAAVDDVLSREAFVEPPRFLGTRLVDLDGDRARAWSVAMAVAGDTPNEVASEPALDVLERTASGWRLVDRQPAGEGPVAPTAPATDDPRVRRLLDLTTARDAVVAEAWTDGRPVVNNHRVELDGDAATVESYAYRPPRWGDAPEVWVDRLERTGAGWRRVEHLIQDNRMPDHLVT